MIIIFLFQLICEHLPNKFKPPGDGLALLTFCGPARNALQITAYQTRKAAQ